VIECPICLVENEESAQFCRECGGRLTPKAAPSPLPVAVQELEPETPPKPRRKLHSPILSGGFEDEEEEPYRETQDTSPRPSPRSQSQNLKKGALRSPLLGGGDQEYEYGYEPAPQSNYEYSQEPEEEIGQPRSRSGMRSPLLNGGGNAKAAKSEFPHRQSSEAPKIERKSSGKLKSPLLDPGDFNPEEQFAEPNLQAKAGGLAKAHHHLRSPLLGGTDEDYYEEEDYEDEQPDPTALRSPLLAARSPRHERQAPANQPINNYAPAVETPAQPSWPQPTAMQAPMQPAFEPQRAPSPSQSQFNLTAGSPNFTPANPYIPVGTNATGQAYPETAPAYGTAPTGPAYATPSPTMQTAAPVIKTPTSPVAAPSTLTDAEERRGSDGDRRANQRRGMGDRRLGSRLLGTAAPDDYQDDLEQPDDEDNGYPASSRGADPGTATKSNAAAPLLMAASAFALIVKAWGLSTLLGNPRLFSDYMPVFLDHVATIAVLFCLIIFSLNSTKK
jgi:hypothetical protein